ncbi:MAG: hypothetical protein JXJ04_25730, partial [Spirochaetales bacterium]|nr:hypothetical protein [Spirochaetales bacterium]
KILLDRAKQYCNNDAGISDWTRWNDGETVTDAVPYSWGCADSIADFNADLEEQRIALSAYYSDGTTGNPYPANNVLLGGNPDPAEHRDWSPGKLNEAPGPEGNDKCHNYLKGIYYKLNKLHIKRNYLNSIFSTPSQ